ncbi:MAG: c-type cytochrome [Deltaproteobacteria bacterium]|nr:c-type cytochrome [Deltaproteobacteria bacterium]
MKKVVTLASAAVIAFSLSAGTAYADGKAVYMANCLACHGDKGQGSPVGPAQKGNKFILESKDEDIKKIILEGRGGKAKKYPKIPGDMLPMKGKISDKDIADVIKFLKTDLQK